MLSGSVFCLMLQFTSLGVHNGRPQDDDMTLVVLQQSVNRDLSAVVSLAVFEGGDKKLCLA